MGRTQDYSGDRGQRGILDQHPDPGWEHTKVRTESHGTVMVRLWITTHS